MGKTINLAEKYSSQVQERFYHDSVTQGAFSKNLDVEFTGVKTVKVYDVATAPLNDYTRSGLNRYGTPKELTDNIYEFVMNEDKGFTYTIDKGNAKEQLNIKQAGASLRRQMREVVTPYIDIYRLKVWAQGAGIAKAMSAAPTKATIGGMIFDAQAEMNNKFVPKTGRTLYLKESLLPTLALSTEYIALDSTGSKALENGVVGRYAGLPIKTIPDSWMPDNVYFILMHKGSAISPMKLNEYKIHTDPQGTSGQLVEGRVIFDAFVIPTKADGIYIATASGKVCETPTISIASNSATLTSGTNGAVIKYTTDGSDPRFSSTAQTYSADSKPTLAADEEIRAAATKTGMYQSGVASKTNS